MNQNKNQLTTTTGTGVALRNASKSLKFINKLLVEAESLTDEDRNWWNSLRPYQQYSLYFNSTNNKVSHDYFKNYNGFDKKLNNAELKSILKLESLKILFEPEKNISSKFLERLNNLRKLHIGYSDLIIRRWQPVINSSYHFSELLGKYHNPIDDRYDGGLNDILICDYKIIENNTGTIDYSPINNLKSLEYLYIFDNNLTDIKFLKDLTFLKEFLILGNINTDNILDYLSLTNLEVMIYSDGIVSQTEKLRIADKLRILYLRNNKIQRLNISFPLLQRLSIIENSLRELKFETPMENLEHICIKKNNITSLTGFSNILNTISLDLSFNRIKDISEIANLKNLKYLRLHGNRIENISALLQLKDLEELDLSQNNIQDIYTLSQLQSLKYLVLSDNPISNREIDWLREQLKSCRIIIDKNKAYY